MRSLSGKIIQKSISPLTSKERKRALVVVDSLCKRPRSKKVELLARLFDHIDGRFKWGLSMLTLGWTDGNTFLPVAFRMLASSKESNRYCEAKNDLDRRTNGAKRGEQAIMGKLDCYNKMQHPSE